MIRFFFYFSHSIKIRSETTRANTYMRRSKAKKKIRLNICLSVCGACGYVQNFTFTLPVEYSSCSIKRSSLFNSVTIWPLLLSIPWLLLLMLLLSLLLALSGSAAMVEMVFSLVVIVDVVKTATEPLIPFMFFFYFQSWWMDTTWRNRIDCFDEFDSMPWMLFQNSFLMEISIEI